MDTTTLGVDDIKAAGERIAPHIQATPLVRADDLADALGFKNRLWLKLENFQLTGSYKLRGALNALMRLSEKDRKRGVVCRSAGNFGSALAYGGQLLSIPITVVMPVQAPEKKRRRAAGYGAEVVIHGKNHVESEARVTEIARESGKKIFSPYNDPDVVAGQGTIGLEIARAGIGRPLVLGPVGGGGLMGGCAVALKGSRVVGVEPEGANDFYLSLKKGERVRVENVDTIADGLRAPIVGDFTWTLLKPGLEECRLVTERAIREAMRNLRDTMGLIVEPSAAVALAALRTDDPDAVCLVTGRNVDLATFEKLVDMS